MEDWLKVDEQLPEDGVDVWVACEDIQCIAYYSEFIGEWIDRRGDVVYPIYWKAFKEKDK